LDKEEKKYLIISIAVALIIGIPSLVLLFLQWANITPFSLMQHLSYILSLTLIALAILVILFIVTVIFHRRKSIERSFRKRFFEKLERKITEELVSEARNRQLGVLRTHLAFIQDRAKEVALSISEGNLPITYTCWSGGTIKTEEIWNIGVGDHGNGTIMSRNEAEILAKKMTEISHNKRYRKNKILFYLFS
jgi:ABC-type multidrug transport system fused ATPase/permease subunit